MLLFFNLTEMEKSLDLCGHGKRQVPGLSGWEMNEVTTLF